MSEQLDSEVLKTVANGMAKAAEADPSRAFLAAVSIAAILTFGALGWKYLTVMEAMAQACGAQ